MMSVRSLLLLVGLGLFAVGCEAKKEEPVPMPEIPAGYESKPGISGMGTGDAPEAEDTAESGETEAAADSTETPAETPPAE